MSNSSRAWLLQSCGKYNEVVPKFLDALKGTGYFNKYYIASDKEMYESPADHYLYKELNKDKGWSNNIIEMLEHIQEDVFFMGCEDHLLVDFNEGLVEAAYQIVNGGNFGCVRLTRKPQITIDESEKKSNYLIYTIDKSYKYYVSLQPSVWSKEYLKKIIRPNESSWQFEILASQRAKELDPPAGVTYKTAFNYKNLIEKGEMAKDPKTYTEIHGT